MALGDTLADTSSARLAIVEESTYGTNPGSGFAYVRFTSEDLKMETQTVESAEVTSDRNPRGAVRVGVNASGSVNFEFSSSSFDTLIEGAMMNDWSSAIALTGKSIDISGSGGGSCTLTDAATAASFANVVVGMWIKLGGFTASVNNTFVRCSAKASSNSITVTGAAFSDEAGQTDITIGNAGYMRIGTTKKSYSIERQWGDAAPTPDVGVLVFDLFTGMRVETWNMTIRPGELITGNFGFRGVIAATLGTTAAGTPTATGSNVIMNAVDHPEGIYVGAFTSVTGLDITEISFGLNNNLRSQMAVSSLFPVGTGLGKATVSGTLVAYVESITELQRYQGFTVSLLGIRLNDDTNAYIIDFPAIRYTMGDDPITGDSADGLATFNWAAEKDANSIAMQVSKFTL